MQVPNSTGMRPAQTAKSAYGAPPTYAQQQPQMAPVYAQPLGPNSYDPQYGQQPMMMAQPVGQPQMMMGGAMNQPQMMQQQQICNIQRPPPTMYMGGFQSTTTKQRTDRQTKCAKACCPSCCFIIGFILLAAGSALIPLGKQALVEAEAMEPEKEFEYLKQYCTITGFTRTTREEVDGQNNRNDNKYACYDEYQYQFGTDGGGPSDGGMSGLDSREWETKRGYEGTCSETEYILNWDELGPFKTPAQGGDDKVDCWRPLADVSRMYSCGNDACYKINDPQKEADGAVATSKTLIAAGEGLVSTGIFLMVVFGAIAACVFTGKGVCKFI